MDGLVPDAGRLRRGGVGVVRGKHVAHLAPPPSQVDRLVDALLSYVTTDRATHPLVKAAIVHYEIEFIHPFSDGNGRLGRLWQHRLMLDVHSIFQHVPVESVIRARQPAYYAALGKADKSGAATPFLEFALDATREALVEFVGDLHPEPATVDTRLGRAHAEFGTREFSRADYSRIFPALSMPTASRDLRWGVDQKLLTREGDKATTRYHFR